MSNLKSFTILIVDDDLNLRELMTDLFEHQGFNLLSADSVPRAFELYKKNKVDLVISDMRMPGEDGLSLLEKVKSYGSNTPNFIFLTGYSDTSVVECIKSGAQKVFAKPFDQNELIEYVKQSLGVQTV